MHRFLVSGVWRSASLTFPDHFDYMAIDSEKHRIINFVTCGADPVRRAPIRMWYRQDHPGTIQTSLKPQSGWSSHDYDEDETTIFWTQGGKKHPWFRIDTQEVPGLTEKLLKAHERMNSEEKAAEQGAAANP